MRVVNSHYVKELIINKIAVLLSGGVDSTVALHLLKSQGFNLTAFYLKVWNEDDTLLGDCPWETDVDYAAQVCRQLDVPIEVVSMQRAYWDRVVDYTLKTVQQGLTPNPDMMCNRLVKFGAFDEKTGHEFEKIATGHWARLQQDEAGNPHLHIGKDRVKDQTYFLSQIKPEQIERALFPLGDFTKTEIRKLAAAQKFANANRKDSQGICFLGKINYRDFLKKHVGEKPGNIVDRDNGTVIGEHNGFWFYTIGQRQGLGLSDGPWFVVDKDSSNNQIFVARGYDPQAVYQTEIELAQFNWIHQPAEFTSGSHPIQFKIRHTPELTNGALTVKNGQLTIHADEPVHGVAAGQFGVIYRHDECLGGGVIV